MDALIGIIMAYKSTDNDSKLAFRYPPVIRKKHINGVLEGLLNKMNSNHDANNNTDINTPTPSTPIDKSSKTVYSNASSENNSPKQSATNSTSSSPSSSHTPSPSCSPSITTRTSNSTNNESPFILRVNGTIVTLKEQHGTDDKEEKNGENGPIIKGGGEVQLTNSSDNSKDSIKAVPSNNTSITGNDVIAADVIASNTTTTTTSATNSNRNYPSSPLPVQRRGSTSYATDPNGPTSNIANNDMATVLPLNLTASTPNSAYHLRGNIMAELLVPNKNLCNDTFSFVIDGTLFIGFPISLVTNYSHPYYNYCGDHKSNADCNCLDCQSSNAHHNHEMAEDGLLTFNVAIALAAGAITKDEEKLFCNMAKELAIVLKHEQYRCNYLSSQLKLIERVRADWLLDVQKKIKRLQRRAKKANITANSTNESINTSSVIKEENTTVLNTSSEKQLVTTPSVSASAKTATKSLSTTNASPSATLPTLSSSATTSSAVATQTNAADTSSPPPHKSTKATDAPLNTSTPKQTTPPQSNLTSKRIPTHKDLIRRLLTVSTLCNELKYIFHSIKLTGIIDLQINKWSNFSFTFHHNNHTQTGAFPLRPYHALLLLSPLHANSYSKKHYQLSMGSSPTLQKFINCITRANSDTISSSYHQNNITKSFQMIQMETGIPTAQIYKMAAHLVYWNRAVIINRLITTNIIVVNPTAAVPDREFVQHFNSLFPNFNLLTELKRFSKKKTMQHHISHFSSSTTMQQTFIDLVAWLLQKNILIQLQEYIILYFPDDSDEENEWELMVEEEYEGEFNNHNSRFNEEEEFNEQISREFCYNAIPLSSREESKLARYDDDSDEFQLLKLLAPYFRGSIQVGEILWLHNVPRSSFDAVLAKFSSILLVCSYQHCHRLKL